MLSEETHASFSVPDAALYDKGPDIDAKLAFLGHALMKGRRRFWSMPA